MLPFDQGLPALLTMTYRRDGGRLALREDQTSNLVEILEVRDYNEELLYSRKATGEYKELFYSPEHYSHLSFSTSYSYRALNGANCLDLHAWILREFLELLNERSIDYCWFEESGGGWFETFAGVVNANSNQLGTKRQWGVLGDPDLGALRLNSSLH